MQEYRVRKAHHVVIVREIDLLKYLGYGMAITLTSECDEREPSRAEPNRRLSRARLQVSFSGRSASGIQTICSRANGRNVHFINGRRRGRFLSFSSCFMAFASAIKQEAAAGSSATNLRRR